MKELPSTNTSIRCTFQFSRTAFSDPSLTDPQPPQPIHQRFSKPTDLVIVALIMTITITTIHLI